jgi:hypothetical protein
MGISFVPGADTRDLQELARRAQAGDKQAQLDLGIAYEEGRGVAVDLKRAERLYRTAARNSGGAVWTYVPPARKGAAGRVIPVSIGSTRNGLIEASERLAQLEGRRK